MPSLPYDYYNAVIKAIEKVAEGMTRARACKEFGISVQTFLNYVERDETLERMYADAIVRGEEALADALLNPDNHELYGHTNPAMAKVMSDNIKWLLARRNPKKYGDKIEIKHEITMDRAITDAMNRAKERAISGLVIEHNADDVIEIVTGDEAIMAELLG